MARRRLYGKWDIPKTVVEIVCGICADYDRREKIIRDTNGYPVGELRECCTKLNTVIDNALEDIEVGARKEILRDVSEGRGYYKSGMQVIFSKNAYYRRKKKLVHDIAKDLALI